MSYEVGAVYRASFTVKDDTGTLVDPEVKTVTVTLPDQTTVTLDITEDAVGVFHADYAITQEGLHKIVVSTVAPNTVSTDYFNATEWRSIVGFQEAKDFVNDSDAGQDPIFRQILAAVTEKVESVVGTCVPARFVNERVTGGSNYRQVMRLAHAPLLGENSVESVTSVWAGGPSWTGDQLITYPDSATIEVDSLWIPFWGGPWKVTYTAGRTVIPASILVAAKEIIYDLWSIHRPYGANTLEPDPEDTARFEQMLVTYQIPPHAVTLLSPFELPGFA